MPRPTFPATLFDYNGVLVDDEAVHLEAFREALAPEGVRVDTAVYWKRYIGFDDAGAFRAMLSDAGRTPTEEQIRALIEAKKPLYLKRARAELRLFPGAADCVRRRAAAGPVVIVSGALRSEIDLGLEALGVAGQVRAIVSAEDTSASKPDPEGYLEGVRLLGQLLEPSRAERALVIEDSVAGVQAAKSAGLTCVAVAHSYPESELDDAGADATFAAVADLTEDALADLYGHAHG